MDESVSEGGQSYNYDDLLEVAKGGPETKEFFTQYTEAIKQGLRYKRRRFTKLLEKKLSEKRGEGDVPGGTGKGPLRRTVDVCTIIDEILESIEEQLSTLTIDRVREDFRKIIWHKESGLETLVERREIKDRIAQQVFAFKKHQKHFFTSHQNALILGSSGIGKSKLGECIAHALSHSGIMVRNGYVCGTPDSIVSPYVDDTRGQCRDFIEGHLEQVILLDEIYSISPAKGPLGDMNNHSHGPQAIDTLVALTDEYKGLCRLYGIGYKKKTMKQFMELNEGMERRFPLVITLVRFSDRGLA